MDWPIGWLIGRSVGRSVNALMGAGKPPKEKLVPPSTSPIPQSHYPQAPPIRKSFYCPSLTQTTTPMNPNPHLNPPHSYTLCREIELVYGRGQEVATIMAWAGRGVATIMAWMGQEGNNNHGMGREGNNNRFVDGAMR